MTTYWTRTTRHAELRGEPTADAMAERNREGGGG